MRIILAWFVLYGHSYAIQKTAGYKDPLNEIFQGSTWIGALAVNGFFAISGFLVTASFIKRGAIDYTISRALRIFPALIVCILLSVFIMHELTKYLVYTIHIAIDISHDKESIFKSVFIAHTITKYSKANNNEPNLEQ